MRARHRHLPAAVWLVFLAACGDDAACPPTEPPGLAVDPDWCSAIHRSGGWGPIIAVVAVAVLVVGVTFGMVPRFRSRRTRFLTLGAVVYLMGGLVSVTVGNANIGVSLEDMAADPLLYLLQLLTWPFWLLLYLSGNYGR